MTVWNSKTQKGLWWKDEKLLRTSGFYQRLEAEARHISNSYASYIKAWKVIQPLLEYFAEDVAALTAIKRGFNTSPQNGGWQHLPDYDVTHNPIPTNRLNKEV